MIIGLTGTLGSGKGTVSKLLQKNGFKHTTLSDRIREEAAKRGISSEHNRKVLQDIGNEFREKYGGNIWILITLKMINPEEDWIIDGIRNLGEIEELKKHKDFRLIAVDAPAELRAERIWRRNKLAEEGRLNSDPTDINEFKKIEQRDRGMGEKESGQQVSLCMGLADFKIINDSGLENLEKKVDSILKNIKR